MAAVAHIRDVDVALQIGEGSGGLPDGIHVARPPEEKAKPLPSLVTREIALTRSWNPLDIGDHWCRSLRNREGVDISLRGHSQGPSVT